MIELELDDSILSIASPASIYYYNDRFGLHIEMYLKGNIKTYKSCCCISYFELLDCASYDKQRRLVENIIKEGRNELLKLVAAGA